MTEEGDDGALHDFWDLTAEEIEALAKLTPEERVALAKRDPTAP
jgi:hypothetical protein